MVLNLPLVFRDIPNEVTGITHTPDFGPVRQQVSAARDEQHPPMMCGDHVILIDDPTLEPQRQADYGAFVQHALHSFDAGEGSSGPR